MQGPAHFINQLKQAKVAVVGLGLSGWSTLKYFQKYGIVADLFDSREQPPLNPEQLEAVADLNCHFGHFSEEQFLNYDFVIVSPGISLMIPSLAKARAQNDNVFCDVELFARINTKPVLAVTGSNGKSTVVAWLEDYLNRVGKKSVACGNYGVPVLDVIDSDVDVFVLELSSFQLESVSSLVCEGASVLNVTEDHMDRYHSFEDYSRAKNKIYKHAKLCLYNQNDFETKPLMSHSKVESFSFIGECHEATCWQFDPQSQYLYKDGTAVADLDLSSMTGAHNGLNALAVMALANTVGVDPSQHLAELYSFSGLPHRCKTVANHQGIEFIDDSKATNIASTEAAISGLASDNNIVLIAGGDAKGGNLGELKASVDGRVKAIVALGQDKEQFLPLLPQGQVFLVDTMFDAVSKVRDVAKPGDLVLLSPACASIDMFANFKQRGEVFAQAVEEVFGGE